MNSTTCAILAQVFNTTILIKDHASAAPQEQVAAHMIRALALSLFAVAPVDTPLMNFPTFATDVLQVNIGMPTTLMVLLQHALTALTTLIAAELTNLASLPFADADQDSKLMYIIKYATLVVQLSTGTIYLLNASLAL